MSLPAQVQAGKDLWQFGSMMFSWRYTSVLGQFVQILVGIESLMPANIRVGLISTQISTSISAICGYLRLSTSIDFSSPRCISDNYSIDNMMIGPLYEVRSESQRRCPTEPLSSEKLTHYYIGLHACNTATKPLHEEWFSSSTYGLVVVWDTACSW